MNSRSSVEQIGAVLKQPEAGIQMPVVELVRKVFVSRRPFTSPRTRLRRRVSPPGPRHKLLSCPAFHRVPATHSAARQRQIRDNEWHVHGNQFAVPNTPLLS
jgi:hypothetical protein